MIAILLTSKNDMNSSILQKRMKEKGVNSLSITPTDKIQITYNQSNLKLRLNNDNLLAIDDVFFINRLPSLDHNHPLITLLYKIPRNKVVTHPTTGASMLSKLHQLQYFKKFPATEVVKGYHTELTNRTCTKSISQIRSYVRASDDAMFNATSVLEMPVIKQDLLQGKHIKTIVLNNSYYSFEFKANSLDPRESGFATVPIDPPKDLIDNMALLKRSMGANYIDIDIILKNAQSYILEVNPSPAPGEFAHLTGDFMVVDRFIDFITHHEYHVYD